ncbi:MAG: DUF4939 domain-containing protein, partial [Cetobacterium sp.]
MNPAEVANLQAAFAYQTEAIKGLQEQLTQLQSVNEHLTHYIRSLPPPSLNTVSLALPDKFDGSAECCRGFIRQVRVYFDHQREKFESDEKRCALLMTLLTGKAINWASAVWDSDVQIRTSVDYFIRQLREVFEYPAGGKNISTQLLHLTQNHRTAADYAVEFRTLAAQSGWNDISLKAVFQRSLSPELQIELACKGDDLSFSEYVNLAIRVDNLMRQAPRRRSARGGQQTHVNPTAHVFTPETTTSEEPMQINFSRLSEEERARRRQFRLCFYCGEAGHRSSGCPHKRQTASRVNI